MIILRNDTVSIDIDPDRGGGILRFEHKGRSIFLPARAGQTALSLSCFAMMPFSNRIENGRFSIDDIDVQMTPNHPPASAVHPIHGHGWLERWDISECREHSAMLEYEHRPSDWPWHYRATQEIKLLKDGYSHHLAIQNLSKTTMPAGMGLHPYFPRDGARLQTIFNGYWNTGKDGLPTNWHARDGMANLPQPQANDRTIDTVYTGRKGPIAIDWPTHRLIITPSSDFPQTHIYAPLDHDYFCVEPCSHMTNAINRNGLNMVAPGDIWHSSVRFLVEAT